MVIWICGDDSLKMGNNLLQVELKGRLLIAKEILWSGTEFRSRAIATKRSGSVWVLFNPCSREGSDPWSCIPARPYSNFNPRSCEGSDFRPDHDIITFARFQSTHPRGERRSNHQSPCVSSKFQSTLPRGERRATSFIFSAYPAISIHAPARGATRVCIDQHLRGVISIHAPARGATIRGRPGGYPHQDFNPRSREGSDCFLLLSGYVSKNFNPRSREGSDSFFHPTRSPVVRFQSTLPRGERLSVLEDIKIAHDISIHAPARGATESRVTKNNIIVISIHAPARGATMTSPGSRWPIGYFNPRSREGSDWRHKDTGYKRFKFQSTLPRGVLFRSMRRRISIHAPARGATPKGVRQVLGRVDFNPRSREGSDSTGIAMCQVHIDISIHAPARGAT